MVTQNQNQINELLNQKELTKFLLILTKADQKYNEYKRYLEQLINFFQDLKLKYEYLSEDDKSYQEKCDEIERYIENLKAILHEVPSPFKAFS